MSQIANIDTNAAASTLFHEIFVDEIKPHINFLSPMAGIYAEAPSGKYRLTGKKVVWYADVHAPPRGMATDGHLPDHQSNEGITLETTPARAYLRKAVDNFHEARGSGEGVFLNYLAKQKEDALKGWERMTAEHVHGGSNGTRAKVASVTSTTKVVLKDGYGHAGTNPVMHFDKGQIIAILDVSNAFAVLGAAKITDVDYGAKEITYSPAIAGAAANDVIVSATTTDTTASYFRTERGYAPLGVRDIIDPDGNSTTYLGKSETTYPRLKPFRMDSTDWTEEEFVRFRTGLRTHGQSPVTKTSHVFSCQEGPVHELAKTLIGYRQAPMSGVKLTGGWENEMVEVAGHGFLIDDYHTHDEVLAHALDDLYAADLGGKENTFADDGSPYQRLPDYDGKEWYMRHYFQRFADRRNRLGALRGVPNPYADAFAPVPH
jgi:hypothetical protein